MPSSLPNPQVRRAFVNRSHPRGDYGPTASVVLPSGLESVTVLGRVTGGEERGGGGHVFFITADFECAASAERGGYGATLLLWLLLALGACLPDESLLLVLHYTPLDTANVSPPCAPLTQRLWRS